MVKLEKTLTEEQKSYLLSNFGKLKVKELSKLTGLKTWTISKFFKNRKLKLSKLQKQEVLNRRDKKYHLNDYFFSESSNKSNYWAGFIAADGCITNNRLQIKLKSTDLSHLEKFRDDINSDCSIKTVCGVRRGNKFESSLLYISSQIILQDLSIKYNIHKRKSLSLKHPNILNNNEIDCFIIGYFDGDGTVYKKKHYLCCRFYGTLEIMKWVKERIDNIYNKNSGSIFKKNNIWCFELNPKATTFFGEYYNSIDSPKLERKWSIFKNFKLTEECQSV